MFSTQSLTATVAAVALVGSIGIAYAQTNTMPAPAADSTMVPATPTSPTTTAPADMNNTTTERAPQVDRN